MTNLEVRLTCEKFAKAGFKVEQPLAKGTQGFWTVTLDVAHGLRLQIYGTRRVLTYARGPEDEARAKQLVERYAVTVDDAPLSWANYKAYPDKKEAAEDLMTLSQALLIDNLNLEIALGILSRDIAAMARSGKQPDYLESLSGLPETLLRSRQQDPLAPVSPLLIERIDPDKKLAEWMPTENLPVPRGTFTQALRTAAATLRDLSQDPSHVSDRLQAQPVADFHSTIQHGALQSFQKLAKRHVAGE